MDLRSSNLDGKMNKLLKIFEAKDDYSTLPKQSKVTVNFDQTDDSGIISEL